MVAPHLCYGCGATGLCLCARCKLYIVMQHKAICVVCRAASGRGVCAEHGLAYRRAWFVGTRSGALREVTEAFKFKFQRQALEELVTLLDMTVPCLPDETIIVSVPTIAAHIRRRGYDHALLLAKAFAERRGLAYRNVVQRSGQAVQHRLNRKERLIAVKDSFFVTEVLAGEPHLIIDDVITTGATVGAVAEALRLGGARTVWVAAIAYQPLD
jgi:ComF family protein